MNPTFSPYAELGVRPDVTLQELKQAYRQAVLRYHPDSAVGAANSLKFHAVTEAYKELRAIVDQSPRDKGSEHQHPTSRKKNQLLDGEQPIDRQTLELDVPALQQLLCESDNSHVRKVAAIALFLKKEASLTRELLAIAKQPAMPSIRKAILSAMHIGPRKKVVPILLAVACESDLEIAVIAIQQLEKIDPSLRGKILFKLRMAHLSLWERTKRVFDPDLLLITQYSQLGDQLCQRGLLSQEQLQIALVLQKKFPLLLGQILRQLNYVQPHELRS
ncbi:MAG: DnaJ domain-containing protein, partial [bacterium]